MQRNPHRPRVGGSGFENYVRSDRHNKYPHRPCVGGNGRVLACEVLVATPPVRAHIRERKEHMCYNEMQMGRKHQMQTMDNAIVDLYQRGEISYDMALSHIREPNVIRQRIGESAAKEGLPSELERQLRRAEK